MTAKLTFRPHHFMCTLGFQGAGYSPGFVENFQAISDQLKGEGGDEAVIEVTDHTDSICAACPHQQDAFCGSDEEFIQSLDRKHRSALELKTGDSITWGQAKKRIAANVNEDKFHEICQGCSWKDLGVCLEALKQLRL